MRQLKTTIYLVLSIGILAASFDPCRQYDFVSCTECTSNGCLWCGADSVCSSPPISWIDETSSCGVSDFVSTCEATILNVFGDPLYGEQSWVYELINVENVWRTGITGAGVHIRINDEGVDANHPEFASKFDKEASCQNYLPDSDNDDHGTACAAIAAANSNDVCSVGIAPDATLSSCNILRNDTTPEWFDSTYLSLHLEKMDVSSNSWGFKTCEHVYDDRRRLDATCPFRPYVDSSPCRASECRGIDWSSPQPSEECEAFIVNYCYFEYENDVNACIEFLDLFVDCSYNALTNSEQRELVKGITEGRGGKGVIYVFASGNDFMNGGDTNFDGPTNSRFIISVGAVGKFGRHSSYSTPGASLFVTGPGGDFEFDRNHVVAKPGGGCGDAGVGTSYAAPVVSGVVALMLQVNPELGWRDVQGILASTSQKAEPDDSSWSTNAAGFHHSHKYGFGLVDAEAAVDSAKVWKNFSSEKQLIAKSDTLNIAIPTDPLDKVTSTVEIESDVTGESIVESAVVYMDLSHASRGDLEVVLTSPGGTESVLHPGMRPENSLLREEERWKLMTVRAWGESATGNWKLSVVDKSEGNHDDCVDDPTWYSTVQTDDGYFLNASCWDMVLGDLCVDGIFVGDDEYQYPTNFTSPIDGKTPTDSCCECGGGIDAATVQNLFRSWSLVVYTHTLTDYLIQEKIVFSLVNIPNRDMDTNEISIFEKSIVAFLNESNILDALGISNLNVKVSEQLVDLFGTADSGQERRPRHHTFRGLEKSTSNSDSEIFYNQVTVNVFGRSDSETSVALFVNSTVGLNLKGLEETLKDTSSTNYFANIENISIINDTGVPPVTFQPTPPSPTTTSSSNSIPVWVWFAMFLGLFVALLLAFTGYSLLRVSKEIAPETNTTNDIVYNQSENYSADAAAASRHSRHSSTKETSDNNTAVGAATTNGNNASTCGANFDEKKSTTTEEQSDGWTCPCCTFINQNTAHRCQVCLLYQQEHSQSYISRNNHQREVGAASAMDNTTIITPLKVGDRVVVRNLTSTTALNGLHGILVMGLDNDTGRYTVHLDTPLVGDGHNISDVGVKLQHLEKEQQQSVQPQLPVTTGSTESPVSDDCNKDQQQQQATKPQAAAATTTTTITNNHQPRKEMSGLEQQDTKPRAAPIGDHHKGGSSWDISRNNHQIQTEPGPTSTMDNNTTISPLKVGVRVVVRNLTSTTALNGLHGIIVMGLDNDTGRYTVHLDTPLEGDGNNIVDVGVKLQNLEKEQHQQQSVQPQSPVNTGSAHPAPPVRDDSNEKEQQQQATKPQAAAATTATTTTTTTNDHQPRKEMSGLEQQDTKPRAATTDNHKDGSYWDCGVCTYKNENPEHLTCSVCGTPKMA